MKLLLALVFGICVLGSRVSAQENLNLLQGSHAEAVLAPERDTLNKQYKNYGKAYYQEVKHPDGSSAILVFQPSGAPRPSLFGISRNDKILWSNYSPTAEVGGAATKIAGDKDGNVLIIWEDHKLQALNARLFDAQGRVAWTNPIVPLPFKTDVNEQEYLWGVNMLFWPGHGWLVTFSSNRRTVVQLLAEQGKPQWGEGTALVSEQQGKNTVSLIQDSPDSIFALWYEHGYLKKPETKSLFRAQRIDATGKPIWATPLEVGEAPSFGWASPHEIQLTLTADQKVRAQLYKGVLNDVTENLSEYQAEIGPQGQVEKREDAPNR
ncbi:hypothetical protein EON83_21670 [bacterium]|nr:MAG: hypothetical protein EON83_21670 [bacterium]